MSGIADVARLAGVSKSTASRALSGRGYTSPTTRARVASAARELGFVASTAAASLATGRTRAVGVVTPSVGRWFFAQAIEGIEGELVGAGYDLSLYRLGADAQQRRRVFEHSLLRNRVDAVITVGIALAPHELEALRSLGKPVVGVGGPVDGIPTLSVDEVAVGRLATEHLIGLGHTRIMHFGGAGDPYDDGDPADSPIELQRLAGFRAALDAAGIPHPDDLRATSFSIPGGYATALAVLADPRGRPTAIVAGCDEIAIGTIIAARQLGIQVPSQLSIVGVDDHELAAMFGLTTLRQLPAAQGALAVRIALAGLDDHATSGGGFSTDSWADVAAAAARTVPVSLRVRTSTTAPPPP
jgi:DNA-binding LacI/PurR family transcriptional regulator